MEEANRATRAIYENGKVISGLCGAAESEMDEEDNWVDYELGYTESEKEQRLMKDRISSGKVTLPDLTPCSYAGYNFDEEMSIQTINSQATNASMGLVGARDDISLGEQSNFFFAPGSNGMGYGDDSAVVTDDSGDQVFTFDTGIGLGPASGFMTPFDLNQ